MESKLFCIVPILKISTNTIEFCYQDIHSPKLIIPFLIYQGSECLKNYKKFTQDLEKEFDNIETNGISINGEKILIKFVWSSDLKSLWLSLFGKSCRGFSHDESGLCPWCNCCKDDIEDFEKWRDATNSIKSKILFINKF